MKTFDLSVILPASGVEQELAGILRFAAAQMSGITTEFLICDMHSLDRTVVEAIHQLEEQKLHGRVVQSGSDRVADALQAGIQVARGEYLTFLYPSRIAGGHFSSYWEISTRLGLDMVYGCASPEEVRGAAARILLRQNGLTHLKMFARGSVLPALEAVFVRRRFLQEKKLAPNPECSYGWEEEFLSMCLLSAQAAAQAPVIPQRNRILGKKEPTQRPPTDNRIFSRVSAALRIFDALRTLPERDKELESLYLQKKLPQTILECTDALLLSGQTMGNIKSFLRVSDYKRLLVCGPLTGKKLRARIRRFQLTPWLYKAE